jgi:hypothetical protein
MEEEVYLFYNNLGQQTTVVDIEGNNNLNVKLGDWDFDHEDLKDHEGRLVTKIKIILDLWSKSWKFCLD